MVKIINAVVLKVITPEIAPAVISMMLPHVSLLDAMQYELEECMRRASFERRFGMTIEDALCKPSSKDVRRVEATCL